MEKTKKYCIASNGLSQKDIISTAYVVEKVARIASVTYILTRVLEDNSAVKEELQKTSIRLLKDATASMQDTTRRIKLLEELSTIILTLEVAERAGVLSKMNVDTLTEDILSFSNYLHTIDWPAGRRYMEENLFGGEVPREIFSPEPIPTRTGPFERHTTDTEQVRPVHQQGQHDGYTPERHRGQSENQRPHYKERVQEVQKDRRATILGLVQRKDKITIKDVTNVIKDCSEKTVQRELLALVRQGVLKKEGERRWSTYTLA